MKTINNYLFILISLMLLLGAPTYLFAAEVTSSIMCDEGVVHIGDLEND